MSFPGIILLLTVSSIIALQNGPVQLSVLKTDSCLGTHQKIKLTNLLSCKRNSATKFMIKQGRLCLPPMLKRTPCLNVYKEKSGNLKFTFIRNYNKSIVFNNDFTIKSPKNFAGNDLYIQRFTDSFKIKIGKPDPAHKNKQLVVLKYPMSDIHPRSFSGHVNKLPITVCSLGGEVSTGNRLAERIQIFRSYIIQFKILPGSFSKSIGSGVMSMVQDQGFNVKLKNFQFRLKYLNRGITIELGNCDGVGIYIEHVELVDNVEYKFYMSFDSSNNTMNLRVRGSNGSIVKNDYNIDKMVNCFINQKTKKPTSAHSQGKTFVLYASAPSIGAKSANMNITNVSYYSFYKKNDCKMKF